MNETRRSAERFDTLTRELWPPKWCTSYLPHRLLWCVYLPPRAQTLSLGRRNRIYPTAIGECSGFILVDFGLSIEHLSIEHGGVVDEVPELNLIRLGNS